VSNKKNKTDKKSVWERSNERKKILGMGISRSGAFEGRRGKC
jgi:hypothetical protein